MSKSVLEQVMGKMVLDPNFRQQVVSDPSSALEGYDLTSQERDALEQMDLNEFHNTLSPLDERVSKLATSRTARLGATNSAPRGA
jgi:hypothetical protein